MGEERVRGGLEPRNTRMDSDTRGKKAYLHV